MARDEVFLDAAGLMGLHLRSDSVHAIASATFAALIESRVSFVTSDWVLAEFLNACSAPRRRRVGAAVVRELQGDATMEIVEATRIGFLRALEFFETRPDKEWGVVDCASILICKDRGIERVFTADHHFEQAGFEILL